MDCTAMPNSGLEHEPSKVTGFRQACVLKTASNSHEHQARPCLPLFSRVLQVPNISRKEYGLIDISDDGFVSDIRHVICIWRAY